MSTSQPRLANKSAEELVSRFVEIGIAQDEALLYDEYRRFNRLYDEKREILDELKSRPGDQRSVLANLYSHANMQVRLNAVHATLAINPMAARQMLEEIAEALSADREALWARVAAADFLTVNDKRAAVGYEPPAYGGLTPRQYLRGRPWADRVNVGHAGLRSVGVLLP